MDTLAAICQSKREWVANRKAAFPIEKLKEYLKSIAPPHSFKAPLEAAKSAHMPGLIAELKRASPSVGPIAPIADLEDIAIAYRMGGANCLSILTDIPFFQGEDADLMDVKEVTPLPILRKDFILDPYQVYESRSLGADCILLILAALTDAEARTLEDLAFSLGMDVLIEVHDADELKRAVKMKSPLIGVNNRSLKTLVVDLTTGESLLPLIPADRIAIAESGIENSTHIARLQKAGADAFLVGSALMRAADHKTAVTELLSGWLPEYHSTRTQK